MNNIPIEEWPNEHVISMDILSEAKTLDHWTRPITIDPITELFDEAYANPPKSKKLFCAYISNAHVNNGRIVDDSLKYEAKEFMNCGSLSSCSKKVTVHAAVHLVDKWGGSNYWHWMSTCLSKLSLIDAIDPESYYIVNSLNAPFVRESLTKMNIPLSQCITINNKQSIYCKTLFALSPMGDRDKEGVLFLRNKLRKDLTPSRKILISRTNSRRIENQDSVDMLKSYGFESIECEKLSFDEQVELFSSASVVVSPHGAGLTNLIFVPNNTKVLELRSPYYYGACYWKLCNHLNLPYYSLIGEGDFPKSVKEFNRSLNSNMTINLEKLEKTLSLMEIE